MSSPELQAPPGVVELREDVPLQPSAGGTRCAGGPRLALGAFAALSLAVTAALLTQLHYGDYEVVPHGSVSSSCAPCSAAGAAALRAGGRAADAAVAAALCLAVAAPHRISLDASGSLLYWEYRGSGMPVSAEWGGPAAPGPPASTAPGPPGPVALGLQGPTVLAPPWPRPPRLLLALAALHARHGVQPWAHALRPAVQLARAGYAVAGGLAAAAAARGVAGYTVSELRTEPTLAAYLESLQHFTSDELCARWACGRAVRWGAAEGRKAGRWRLWTAGAGGARASAALTAGLTGGDGALAASLSGADGILPAVLSALQRQAHASPASAGVASGLAVVDPWDTYLALVAIGANEHTGYNVITAAHDLNRGLPTFKLGIRKSGLSTPFGSEEQNATHAWAPNATHSRALNATHEWAVDEPNAELDVAPAIITDEHVCGTRYVVGAESGAALAQGGAALLAAGADGAVQAVERARLLLLPSGELRAEPSRVLPAGASPSTASDPALPLPAVNFVRQRGDALLSHADSRGGGVASRF